MNLTTTQLDALRAVSDIGMEHAATALSQLVGESFDLQVHRITLAEVERVPAMLGGSERAVACITLQVLGDARGNILLVFSPESAKQLLSMLLGRSRGGPVLDELGTSTLKEVGNIVSSAYLSALGSQLGLTLIPSVPMLACDLAGEVVGRVLPPIRRGGDTALIVETEFQTRHSSPTIRGHFFLLPDAASLMHLLSRMEGGR